MFNQLIKPTSSDGRELFVQALKTDHLPIIIYGTGTIGTHIFKYLQTQNIEISGFCVDTQYLSSNTSFHSIPIYASSQVDSYFERYNIIIGFDINHSTFLSLKEILFKRCNHFYFLPHIDFMPPIEYTFFQENLQRFQQTYFLLNDDLSKQTMVAYINSKLHSLLGCELLDLWQGHQYFTDFIHLPTDEPLVFVDCGAFTGDTLVDFIQFANTNIVKYYAFEPDPVNRLKLAETIEHEQSTYVEIVPKGTWSKKTTLSFNISGNSASCINENGNTTIEVTSIDDVINDEFVSFIKMDVEGSEFESLKGARNTILQHMPILAICVYHKPEDLITIPQYIASFETAEKKYTFYLRHHSALLNETVLYAIPIAK